ncbi:helix-turn-helix domain-containing protein [Actinocorallia sp. A-T 12471]|uniref:helix-turn-helix domain-containing protein n=1 Tax=Actinocorallia sp. A-T 12471 TaxID=3089813 RepID=UPI0029D311F0|nr:helix-turn-helix domain-containing protein [Actinocorallia sp. A-T 12471]MDX6743982.1 helix-turn-helix domain-containing protein [Actinocorallia sp. A-T 12471]
MTSDLDALTSELLGARLRELREGTGRSLRSLAKDLGISPSAVSQIERGVLRPSVSRLLAYVTALGVPLSAVFDAGAAKEREEHAFAVRRSFEVAPIELGGGVLFRRLSPVPTRGLEFFESLYPPGAAADGHGRLLRHEGYEVGTVTEGELTIDFDDDVVTLAAGDSITYPCDRPHLIANRSATARAVATWLIVHP